VLRVGIVGMGFGASVHLPAFFSIPGVEVVAVAASSVEKASQVVRDSKIPHAFDDWRALVNSPEVDVVSVATPPASQAEIVCAALEADKHVFCEKPFGKDIFDALEMFKIAKRKSHLINAVGFEYRMEPGIKALKQQVETGSIGQVIRIDLTWLTGGQSNFSAPWTWHDDAKVGGGVINAFGSHVIDYVEWIAESPIVSVVAQSRIFAGNRRDKNGQERSVTAEQDCDVICRLGNGGCVKMSFSNYYPFSLGHRIEVYGEKGRLVFFHGAPFTPNSATVFIETDNRGLSSLSLEKPWTTTGADSRLLAFRELAFCFIGAILKLNPGCDLPDFSCGLRVRKVIQAIQESIQQGRQIQITSD